MNKAQNLANFASPSPLIETLKKLAQATLTPEQKNILRDAVNLRVFSPKLSNNLALILGCQRSGTTLSLLMLQVHPNIKGVDETELFYSLPFPSSLELFWQKQRRKLICLKLPQHTAALNYIARYFPQAKILWIVRNPYSVLSSMRLLTNPEGTFIERRAMKELMRLSPLFPEIKDLKFDELDDVSMGAYFWYYKNSAIKLFRQKGLNVFDFKYEDLLEQPKETMVKILDFLELEWSDQVLEYYKFHQENKSYPGNTKGDKPLDKSRKGSTIDFTNEEKEIIASINQELMDHYGYNSTM